MKYPKGVKALALISPVGLPSPAKLLGSNEASVALPVFLSTFMAAWSANITPQSFIRMLGSRGRKVILGAVERRFSGQYSQRIPWNATELELISDYLYHITVAPPSGEYSMNSLLKVVTLTFFLLKDI